MSLDMSIQAYQSLDNADSYTSSLIVSDYAHAPFNYSEEIILLIMYSRNIIEMIFCLLFQIIVMKILAIELLSF